MIAEAVVEDVEEGRVHREGLAHERLHSGLHDARVDTWQVRAIMDVREPRESVVFGHAQKKLDRVDVADSERVPFVQRMVVSRANSHAATSHLALPGSGLSLA